MVITPVTAMTVSLQAKSRLLSIQTFNRNLTKSQGARWLSLVYSDYSSTGERSAMNLRKVKGIFSWSLSMTMLGEGEDVERTQQSAGGRDVALGLTTSEMLSDVCSRRPFLQVFAHQPSDEDFLATEQQSLSRQRNICVVFMLEILLRGTSSD